MRELKGRAAGPPPAAGPELLSAVHRRAGRARGRSSTPGAAGEHRADRPGGDQHGPRRVDGRSRAPRQQPVRPQSGVLVFIGCTGADIGEPAHLRLVCGSGGSSGFTAEDWTAVVNQTLAEIYAAQADVALLRGARALNSDTSWTRTRSCRRFRAAAALDQAAGEQPDGTISRRRCSRPGWGSPARSRGVESRRSVRHWDRLLSRGDRPLGVARTITGPSFNGTLTDLQERPGQRRHRGDAQQCRLAEATGAPEPRDAAARRRAHGDRAVRGTRSTPQGLRGA